MAILFGAMTLFAGSRVLAGTNPGYGVYLPLLIYNTVMGGFYIAVGVSAWRSLALGKRGAALLFLLNLIVLVAIGVSYTAGGSVASESLGAMALRTGVWLMIFVGLWWLARKHAVADHQI